MASITTNSSRTQQQPVAEVLPKNEREKKVPYKNFGELKKKTQLASFFLLCAGRNLKKFHILLAWVYLSRNLVKVVILILPRSHMVAWFPKRDNKDMLAAFSISRSTRVRPERYACISFFFFSFSRGPSSTILCVREWRICPLVASIKETLGRKHQWGEKSCPT